LKIVIASFILGLISSGASGEQITSDGITYSVEVDQVELDCTSFKMASVVKSLPSNISESKIPYEITMGHYGNPYALSQTILYISPSVAPAAIAVEKIQPVYSRIDPTRKYLATPEKCLPKNSVLFSFWGGGNCTNVCEAWGRVYFSTKGEILEVKGLNYQELEKFNQ
jgi:hypothetical protein